MADLPAFDKALSTRNFCAVGLLLSWILGAGCCISAGFISKRGLLSGTATIGTGNPPLFNRTGFPLLLNFAVAIATECMGYIHTTSLRWALWRENRLSFNTNLRLLTSARRCAPNRWYTNIISSACLVLSYASASQVFPTPMLAVEGDISGNSVVNGISYTFDGGGWGLPVNGIAVAALGIGLVGQAAIASWCLLYLWNHTPTWSSNPLNTTLTCHHLGLVHHPNRCLRAVDAVDFPSVPAHPSTLQPSAWAAESSIRYVTGFIWISVPVTIAWAVAVLVLTLRRNKHPFFAFYINPDTGDFHIANVAFLFSPTSSPYLISFLIVAGLQTFYTICLHCAELVVNVSRDEGIWRQASTPAFPITIPIIPPNKERKAIVPGAPIRLGSIKAVLTSWQSLVLFAFKPIVHWLFGLSVEVFAQDRYNSDFNLPHYQGAVVIMNPISLHVLAAACLLLASMVAFLAWKRPRGYQPAAWGHLQTLADLVDDWGPPDGADDRRLWWGDKGCVDASGIRHSGTSVHEEDVTPLLNSSEYL